MSRLIASNLLNRILVTQIRIFQRPSVIPPMRFLSVWQKTRPPIDPKEIELRVFKSISTHDKIDPNQIKISSHLSNDLGLDSLDQVEIMVALEDEFNIAIDDVDAEKIYTIQDIISFVINYLESQPDRKVNPGAKYDPKMKFGPY